MTGGYWIRLAFVICLQITGIPDATKFLVNKAIFTAENQKFKYFLGEMVVLTNFLAPTEGIKHQQPSTSLFVNNRDVGVGTLYITER